MGNSGFAHRMAAAKKTWSRELKGLGTRARYAREQAGYGLREAADLADIDDSSLSRLEAGERLVNFDALIRLSKLYNVTLDWLMANRPPMRPRESNGSDGPAPAGDRRRRAIDAD